MLFFVFSHLISTLCSLARHVFGFLSSAHPDCSQLFLVLHDNDDKGYIGWTHMFRPSSDSCDLCPVNCCFLPNFPISRTVSGLTCLPCQ
ncbi:hypothetical protein QBC45DRAFT_209782 [Copromyces sp. CBS 386.78]|nr:hypothetical protein QBC45DRAFT_209782 [Copromyces sp. CBS 386.78]